MRSGSLEGVGDEGSTMVRARPVEFLEALAEYVLMGASSRALPRVARISLGNGEAGAVAGGGAWGSKDDEGISHFA